MSAQQKIIDRAINNQDEILRATVISEPVLTAFDTAGLRSRVFLINCAIAGVDQKIIGVIVQSQTGTGGRQYARVGKPVLIKRNLAGRWICIGPSDRTTGIGTVQILNELDETSTAPIDGLGLTFDRVAFEFYADNAIWANGTIPFNLVRTLDSSGTEV